MEDVDVSAAVAGLSAAEKKEVGDLIQKTQQQVQVNEIVNSLSGTCFKKCITGKITSDSLSSSEQSCAANCVARWLDTQTSILKNLSGQQVGTARSGGFFG